MLRLCIIIIENLTTFFTFFFLFQGLILSMVMMEICSEPQGPSYLPPSGGAAARPGGGGGGGHPDEWAGVCYLNLFILFYYFYTEIDFIFWFYFHDVLTVLGSSKLRVFI